MRYLFYVLSALMALILVCQLAEAEFSCSAAAHGKQKGDLESCAAKKVTEQIEVSDTSDTELEKTEEENKPEPEAAAVSTSWIEFVMQIISFLFKVIGMWTG